MDDNSEQQDIVAITHSASIGLVYKVQHEVGRCGRSVGSTVAELAPNVGTGI
jgi:hypothetical protein